MLKLFIYTYYYGLWRLACTYGIIEYCCSHGCSQSYIIFILALYIDIIIRLRLHVILYTENEDDDDQAVKVKSDEECIDTPAHIAAQSNTLALVFTDPTFSIISIRHNNYYTVFYQDYAHPNFMLQSSFRCDGLNF